MGQRSLAIIQRNNSIWTRNFRQKLIVFVPAEERAERQGGILPRFLHPCSLFIPRTVSQSVTPPPPRGRSIWNSILLDSGYCPPPLSICSPFAWASLHGRWSEKELKTRTSGGPPLRALWNADQPYGKVLAKHVTESIWLAGNPTPGTPEATLWTWAEPRRLVKMACPDSLRSPFFFLFFFTHDTAWRRGWGRFFWTCSDKNRKMKKKKKS